MQEFWGNKTRGSIATGLFVALFVSLISAFVSSSDVFAYTASISTSGTVTTNVKPKGDGTTGTSVSTDSVNVVTNCRAGYNLTISGPSDRNLYKDGDSSNNTSGQYFTPVDGTSTLINTTNAWGYSLTANTESGVFSPLPTTPTLIKTAAQTASQTDINDNISVYYGVSVANSLAPGLYKMADSGTILYQLTLDDSCMIYTVAFNANGGSGTMVNQEITADTTAKLTANAFTAPALGQSYQNAAGTTIPATADKMWTFWGWNTAIDGSGDWYKDRESVTNLTNAGSTITLYAQWKQATLNDMTTPTTGTKPITHDTMQDMSAATCYNSDITTKAELEAASKTGAVTLTDNRDGTTRSYDVSKLADGMCWMTTNLALGTTTDITLTADDTDLAPNTTFTLPAGDTTAYTSTTNLAKVRLTNTSSATTNGAYYTWNAATANTTSTSTTPTTSICPRNWDLPTNAQYTTLSAASAYSSSNPTTDLPSQFKIDGGFTDGASFNQTSYSYFWTATSSSTTIAYNRRVNSTSLYSSSSTTESYGGGYKYYRKNIRCVANAGSANITYHSNNTASATSVQAINIATGSLASSSLFTPETHKQFKEWNTRPDGTGTSYAAGVAASSVGLYPDQSLDLYAIWNEVYYIAFNANGGTGSMTNQTVVRDTATAIKTNTFTYTGQIFRGWNTSPDGMGTFYSDGQKVTNLTAVGNTINLYAIWVNGALLDTGQSVNGKLKRLAGNSSATYQYQNNTITAIARSNSLPNDFTPATANTISHSSSPFPIYAWYDSTNTTIYYYSEATNIIMNKDSSYFFYAMRALSDLSTISTWDTIKVTNMLNMFNSAGYNATSFILDLSSWNTSSVTNMGSMFNAAGRNATTWSIGGLSGWDTSSVTSMTSMFYNAGYSATTFTLNLSNWNVSNVTTMDTMFDNAGYSATTWSVGDLSSWNTSSVTDMSGMFYSAGRNATTWTVGDLSDWDTANVTDMSIMFEFAGYSVTNFDISFVSSWDTSSVTDMERMFSRAGYSATTWTVGNLSSWDTSNVTNMVGVFEYAGYSATTFTLNLSNWNVSNVTSMVYMFWYSGHNATTWSIVGLSSWNTSSVTDMDYMFSYAGYSASSFTLNLSSWNTASVTSMRSMFSSAGYSASSFTLNLSSWNTASVTTMASMFSSTGYSATTFTLNLSSWNVSSVTSMSGMFSGTGYSATTWSIGNLSSWNTANVKNMEDMFNNAGYKAKTFNISYISSWNTISVTNMGQMFYNAGHDATTWSVGNLSSWNTSSVTSMFEMFYFAGYSATTWSVGNLSSWNTSSVTNMGDMFSYAGYSASSFTLNLSSWDTSSVTRMSSMFYYAGNSATTWKVTIPKTNNGTTTGSIANTTSRWYGKTTSAYAAPHTGKSFTLAN